MTTRRKFRAALGGALALVFGSAVQAALTLPGGDNFQNGTFEFGWGEQGSARIDPALYVGGNTDFPTGLDTVFLPAGDVSGNTGLTFDYDISGLGTGTIAITYSILNNTATDWHNLRFIGDVSGDTFDTRMEHAAVVGAGGGADDPVRFGIDDFFAGDLFLNDILNQGQLDGVDHCAGPCEAEGALQWDLAQLGQGQTWVIAILLSDSGEMNSERAIAFTLTDAGGIVLDPAQVLSFSGAATVVPLPASQLLLASATLALALWRRRRSEV